MKAKCDFGNGVIECKVTENMGFQGGNHVRAVEHEGRERIVIKVGDIWRPKQPIEKLMPISKYTGQ